MRGVPTCWKCGYELSGLPEEGECPECGTERPATPPQDPLVRWVEISLAFTAAASTAIFCFGMTLPFAIIGAALAIYCAVQTHRRRGGWHCRPWIWTALALPIAIFVLVFALIAIGQ